jgi:hypothetical protein
MAEIENPAVHERATALAKRDGFAWEFGFHRPGSKIEVQRFLSGARCRQYVTLAREGLCEEAVNAREQGGLAG